LVVPLPGWVEVFAGPARLASMGRRLMLPLFAGQMIGTFLVLILLPEIAFQDGSTFKLTVEGEFIVKNLVLLSAGLVIGATVGGERLPGPAESNADVLVP
jgi:uncharacterized membrane protein YkgB